MSRRSRVAWDGDAGLAWGMTIADAAAIAVAVYVAQVVRFGDVGIGPAVIGIDRIDVAYAATGAALAITWLVSLSATRSRLPRNIGTGMVEYERVLRATRRHLRGLRDRGVPAAGRHRARLSRDRTAARPAPPDPRPRALACGAAPDAARRPLHDGRHRRRRRGGCAARPAPARPQLSRRLPGHRREPARGAASGDRCHVRICASRPAVRAVRRGGRDLQAHPHPCGDRGRRRPGRQRRDPLPRLAARELEGRADPHVAPDRRRGAPHPHAAHQRAADGARRSAAVLRLQPCVQAALRCRALRARAARARAGLRGDRYRDPARRRRTRSSSARSAWGSGVRTSHC